MSFPRSSHIMTCQKIERLGSISSVHESSQEGDQYQGSVSNGFSFLNLNVKLSSSRPKVLLSCSTDPVIILCKIQRGAKNT